MATGRVSGLFLSLVVLSISPGLSAQEFALSHEIHVTSCPRADSVLGPVNRVRGTVRGEHDSIRGYTSYITGDAGRRISTLSFSVSVNYTGPGPIMTPKGYLHLAVFGDRALEREARGQNPIALRIMVDDTLDLDLGPVTSRSPIQAPGSMVTVSVPLSPDRLLILAKARKAKLTVGSRRLDIPRPRLEEIDAVFRAAVCVGPGTLPPSNPAAEITLPRNP